MTNESIEALQAKLSMYEQNGAAKMYYALNRKLNEVADLLNGSSLKNVNLNDTADKSFDRIFKLLEKSEVIANASKALGEIAGVTGNEAVDINKKPFVDTIAVSR